MKILIKTCLCFAMLIYCIKSTAQVDTSTTQKLLQYIMQPLDKNQIPTGFLEEYGCPMLSPTTFNGILTDSNRIDMNLWRTLYLQLQTGWVRATANPLPTIISVNNTIRQNVSGTQPIPIPVLIASYNNVKSNAFSSNLLSYNSSTKQVSDVAGRPQSPYNSKTLFAACPNKNITTVGTESFVVKSNMIWNNSAKTISQIQIDFANGQGFQTITVGTAVNISYADTGFKKWTIKITLSDNSILQCYNEYNVLRTANNIASRYEPSTGFLNGFDAQWNFAANATDSGGRVFIAYTSRNRTNTIRKPLIVVEGYDVSRIAPSLQDNYGYNDIIRAINEPFPLYDFNNSLDTLAGYDLIFIDFFNGADSITRNANFVRRVIDSVNRAKVLNNNNGNIREQNVVMGLSMGGLCARYALANMTKNFPGTPTETRLLITHDSPHKGANVPLGLQYMIRMLGGVQLFGYNVFDIYPDYNDAIGLLNAPATQQMLLYRATTTNAFANNTFLEGIYRPMITFNATGPQPTYRFIATANGNECANPLFAPGKTFVNLGAGVSAGVYARFLFFKVPILDYKLAAQVEAYALPAAGSTNKIAKVYTINNLKLFGFINIFKQLYDNTAYAPGTHLAIDGVPGSNYPLLNVDALNQLTTLPIFKVNLYVSFPLGPFLGGYFGVYAYNSGVSYNFTFVSVGSALDVNPYNTQTFSQRYVNGSNQNYPSTSNTFIAQETVQNNPSVSNNVHIRFTARNSRWLFNEMENLNNLENCSAECSNPYYITGDAQACNVANVFVAGLQRGVSVTWSYTPSNAGTAVANGNSYTLTKSSSFNGAVTVTAVIGAGCNNGSTITKVIDMGSPVGTINFQRIGGSCYYQAVFTSTQLLNTYEWSDDGINYSPSGTGNTYGMYLPAPGNNIPVYARAINPCGTLNRQRNFTITTVPGGCTYRAGQKIANQSPVITANNEQVFEPLSVYPNPASQNWQLIINSKTPKPAMIYLTDISGRVIWSQQNNLKLSSNLVIPANNLLKGIYFLKAVIDGSVQTLKLEKN